VLGAHPKNNAVCCLLHGLQDQLFRRWQRTPNKVNTLAHPFKVSNLSSFHSQACTESAEDPLNRIFRTFGANKKQKFPAINNLHGLSNHAFTLFPKSIQVVDWDRLVRSFFV
jgi:hypothetical protein